MNTVYASLNLIFRSQHIHETTCLLRGLTGYNLNTLINNLHGSTLDIIGKAGSNIGLGSIILALLNGILVLMLRLPSLQRQLEGVSK